VALEHGRPLVFGKDRNKGIRLRGWEPEVVTLGKDGVREADLLVHDERAHQPTLAYLLSRLHEPEFPVPVGVFYAVDRPILEEILEHQSTQATARFGAGSLDRLLNSGPNWEIS
jgi:2-oxoglutarate ferredoxin oxidoreductase subunit beta